MKKLFYKSIAVMALLGIYILCTGFLPFRGIRGDGNLITSEITVSEFQRINSTYTANVRFHASEEYRVVLTADSNLAEFVEISTRNGVLNISVRGTRGNYRFTQFLVDVYAPTLAGVSISGSGSFTAVDKITAPTFAASVSGSGSITGTFKNNNFSARISGSGRINGTFESDNFSANISGSGRITAAGTSENATVTISGSGNFNGNNF